MKTEELIKKVTELNNNTPNGLIIDADTILADVLSTSDKEVSGLFDEIVGIYNKTYDKESFQELFYVLTGKMFDEYLTLCIHNISR